MTRLPSSARPLSLSWTNFYGLFLLYLSAASSPISRPSLHYLHNDKVTNLLDMGHTYLLPSIFKAGYSPNFALSGAGNTVSAWYMGRRDHCLSWSRHLHLTIFLEEK
jgi:hypothetical protein